MQGNQKNELKRVNSMQAKVPEFDQADEQALRTLVERFAKDEVAPFVTQWDAAGEHRSITTLGKHPRGGVLHACLAQQRLHRHAGPFGATRHAVDFLR